MGNRHTTLRESRRPPRMKRRAEAPARNASQITGDGSAAVIALTVNKLVVPEGHGPRHLLGTGQEHEKATSTLALVSTDPAR